MILRLAVALALATFGASVAHAAEIVRPAPTGEPWPAASAARLGHDLDALLAASPAARGAHIGVLALESRSGRVLYARDADDEFQPASTLKLLVGSAALERLGPAFRFRTLAYERGRQNGSEPSVGGGTLHGDLVLRGGGDPFLGAGDLDDFAAAVAKAGIARVEGSLVIDPTRYDRKPYPDGWVWDDFGQDYAPVLSAMTLEENVIHLTVTPRADGTAADVSATPLAAAAQVPLEGCPPTRDVVVIALARLLPAGSLSTLDIVRDRNDCIHVTGGIASDAKPESIDAAVPSPEAYAYRLALVKLQAHGVDPGTFETFAPKPWDYATALPMPPGAPLVWTHDSAPLGSFLGDRFWIPSDNLVAELLLKELGYATGQTPGTTEKGVAYEKAFLRSIGVDPRTVTLADGSGLSQYDRITPRDLVAILQHDFSAQYRDLVLDSLPVGGARGTIEGIAGTPLAGRVFAKTGSMSHVRGLAGYLATFRHGAVTFAFNVDDWNGDYPALAALRATILTRIAQD